jgi:hypothetical protein
MKNIFFTLLLLISSHLSFSQNYWKETPSSPTNMVDYGNTCIAINSDNTLFTGTLQSGIYRSFNQGATWDKCLDLTGVSVNKIICKNAFEMFALTSKAIYYSENKGTTWQKFDFPTTYELTDLEVLPNGNLIASTAMIKDFPDGSYEYYGEGVFISSSNGRNWKNSSKGLLYNKAITHLAVNAKGFMLASMASFTSGQGGVYYSVNGGEEWFIMPKIRFKGHKTGADYSPESMYEIHCLEFDAQDNVYVSFHGSGGNFGFEGGFYTKFTSAIAAEQWYPLALNKLGFEWQFHPFHSIFYTKNQEHRYASLNTFNSVSFGGAYVNRAKVSTDKRVVSGISPVRNSYLKMMFVENTNGRIFAIQNLDHRVYYTDSAISKPTGIDKISKTGLLLSPNPSSSFVNLQFENKEEQIVKAQLFDMQGRLVQEETNLYNNQFIFDINKQLHGLYLILIQTNTSKYSELIKID